MFLLEEAQNNYPETFDWTNCHGKILKPSAGEVINQEKTNYFMPI